MSKSKLKELEAALEERQKHLLPIYHQVSVTFADLHDTPGRMLQKKVIKKIIDWPHSRKHFYWRFRRLIARNNLILAIGDYTRNQIGFDEAHDLVKKCFYRSFNDAVNKSQIEV